MGDPVTGVTTFVKRMTANRKTGPVALSTYRNQGSCPTTCSLYGAGCYAENRTIGGGSSPFMVGEKGAPDMTALLAEIRKLRRGEIVRLNVSGDYLLPDGTPDQAYIDATNTIPPYVEVLSYTHAWRTLRPEWFKDHTRPNASCDSIADVAEALSMGWKAVVVDPDGSLPGMVVGGEKLVSCPFETHERQCLDCRLCARGKRSSVVVFQVHGTGKKKARAALAGKNEVAA